MASNIETLSNAIDWIVTQDTPPSLDTIAKKFDYEPTYFQKLFKSHVGVSPKHFTHYMFYKRARDLLLDGYSTLDAAYEAGLSGQGRLHDLFLKVEGMTPGSVKDRGKDITITYGFAPTFMGELMVAKTDKGICWLGFQVDESRDRSLQRMFHYWPLANFIEGDLTGEIEKIESLCRHCEERSDEAIQNSDYNKNSGLPQSRSLSSRRRGLPRNDKLRLDLYGTNMQLQVWQALLKIPFGAVTDYKAIAQSMDKPKAARAVGNAVGMNPVSLLIPCHRVIQSTGIINNYGWGSPRKKIILGIEGQSSQSM